MCIYSGYPANEDSYTINSYHAFEGRAIAVVRTKDAGNVTLTVGSNNLKRDLVSIQAYINIK